MTYTKTKRFHDAFNSKFQKSDIHSQFGRIDSKLFSDSISDDVQSYSVPFDMKFFIQISSVDKLRLWCGLYHLHATWTEPNSFDRQPKNITVWTWKLCQDGWSEDEMPIIFYFVLLHFFHFWFCFCPFRFLLDFSCFQTNRKMIFVLVCFCYCFPSSISVYCYFKTFFSLFFMLIC